jgi:hypothetical protein
MKLVLRTSKHRLQLKCLSALLVAAALLSGCAALRPDIRTDYDRAADFSAYETYGFPDELGTDRAGYATLITTHFRQAVDHEMQSRGYRYTETQPDLLVNFFANVRYVTTVRSRPRMWVSYGYYGYRYGMYSAWPLYAEDVDTVHYRIGTANIDIVDADRGQLIWEGVAEGRLTSEVMENPQPAIESVVAELFSRYPGRARGSNWD